MATFENAIPRLLYWEGGYVNDPADHGGETNYGITQRAWIAWLVSLGESKSNLPASVKDMTAEHARLFYLLDYWIPLQCRQIQSQAVADALFSFAVNQGKGRAVKRLQLILGVTQDGKIGPKTLEAINAQDGNELCNQFCLMTSIYFNSLIIKRPSLMKFAKGWDNRVEAYKVTA
jgi:type VI secretion system secreted protein VgrG